MLPDRLSPDGDVPYESLDASLWSTLIAQWLFQTIGQLANDVGDFSGLDMMGEDREYGFHHRLR